MNAVRKWMLYDFIIMIILKAFIIFINDLLKKERYCEEKNKEK